MYTVHEDFLEFFSENIFKNLFNKRDFSQFLCTSETTVKQQIFRCSVKTDELIIFLIFFSPRLCCRLHPSASSSLQPPCGFSQTQPDQQFLHHQPPGDNWRVSFFPFSISFLLLWHWEATRAKSREQNLRNGVKSAESR